VESGSAVNGAASSVEVEASVVLSAVSGAAWAILLLSHVMTIRASRGETKLSALTSKYII
jgi:hypothetical protein